MAQIRLRALEPHDIDHIYLWENDPSVWEHSIHHTPFSRHELTQYILEASLSDIYSTKQLRLIAEDCNSNTVVGCIDLTNFDPYHKRAEVGIIVDPTFRNQGYGKAIVSSLLPFCNSSLQLHQLYCIVNATNLPSIHIFQSNGFFQIATLPQWIKTDNGWVDAMMFSRLLG